MDFVRTDVNNSEESHCSKGFHLAFDGLVLPLQYINEFPLFDPHKSNFIFTSINFLYDTNEISEGDFALSLGWLRTNGKICLVQLKTNS